MNDEDNCSDPSGAGDGDPTAQGIMQCLRMLADEAASLQLRRTLAALHTALLVCADEGETDDPAVPADASPCGTPLLH